MKNFLQSFKAYRAIQSLPDAQREIVFYSEGAAYWAYLGPMLLEMLKDTYQSICYVTQDPLDPILLNPPSNLHTFCIPSEFFRILFFKALKAKMVVMTMPDLETFHIKKSAQVQRYVYVHHSLVSTHMVYRQEAFDHFDIIMCAGQHHKKETKAREAHLNLPEKQLIAHGYAPLDALLAQAAKSANSLGNVPHVLIAPSWGEPGLIESHGLELCKTLLDAGFKVSLRPHPRTWQFAQKKLDDLMQTFAENPFFQMDRQVSSRESYESAHVMISDWSGAAFEFAYAYIRPVIFVDTPRKVRNPNYAELEIVPFEVEQRESIGKLLAPNAMESLPQMVMSLIAQPEWADKITASRQQACYNLGRSAEAGAKELIAVLQKL